MQTKYLMLLLLTLATVCIALAATPQQAMIRTLDLPASAQPQLLTGDGVGNLYVVSNILEPSGRPQIRVLKTDAQGITLATMDFGGSNPSFARDTVAGAAVDSKGNLIIVGSTSSADFPLVSPLIADNGTAPWGAFITKVDPQLKTILFSTLLSGTQNGTTAAGLALDKSGNIYVTGRTGDADFPVTKGAFQTSPPQQNKLTTASYAFVTEIGADNKSFVFSTYFGDSTLACPDPTKCAEFLATTSGTTIALDPAGNVVIGGSTDADQLPITPGVIGPNCGGCGYLATAGFFAKFSPDGSKLVWAIISLTNPSCGDRLDGKGDEQ